MALPAASRTERLLALFPRGVALLILAGIFFVPAFQAEGEKEGGGKPRVYNVIVKEVEPVDQLIRERYGRKYDVIEFRKDSTYVGAKLTKSRFPNPVFNDENVEVCGSVHVCVVVTPGGRVVDPIIFRSANPLLEGPVLEALKEYRAVPARLNGAPIATVEALKFTFGPPPRRRIDR